MPKITVIGCGGWGTAMACLLAGKTQNDVTLWSYRDDLSKNLNQTRENAGVLPGVTIPDSIKITSDFSDDILNSDCWVTAIPTTFLKMTLQRFQNIKPPKVVLSLTKGIDSESFQRPSEIIAEILKPDQIAVLSGPNHAEEIARKKPASAVIAAHDSATAVWCQELFGTDRFRVYTNQDLIGVELAGALKNVVGIAAGMCDGLGIGDNGKAALLTRGLAEMTRFGVAHGAEVSTFYGLAGMGDLIATCVSSHGRNRRLGERIARGEPFEDAIKGPMVAEGANTAKSVYNRATAMKIDMPIMTGVYRALYEKRLPQEVMGDLLGRAMKGEWR